MRPNFKKVVYYLCLIEVSGWKSGPESGPDKWSSTLGSFNLFGKSGENGAPGMKFDACPKRHLVSVSSYFNRLAKR